MEPQNFKKYHRVLVVAANNETILNTNYAPKDMKYKVIKSDQLIRTLEYDLEHSDKNIWDSKKNMIERANFYLCINNNENINYYDYYKNKYCNNDYINKDALKKELLDFRKKRSRDMNVPAYYVFTNEELNKIIELIPNTIEELKNLNILTPVKIKTHGNQIISIINNINREK